MRQFDTLQSYMDNDGCPLVGRARFCKDEGGELKAIMDCDGNLIDSIVFTDASGRLSRQVFLDDSDYYVFFDRYDGNANPFTDDDDDSWNNQFSVKSLYDTFNIVVDTVGEQCVDTIEDLRELDPRIVHGDSARKFVKVMGYYEPGDKEPVHYYWDLADTSGDDDGGSIIKVEGIEQGRWHLVSGLTIVDVRHFGAFPNSAPQIEPEQNNSVYHAVIYAQEHGLNVFFPSVGNDIYYDVSGRTLSGISMSSNARLLCKSGATTDISKVESVYLYADEDDELAGTINVRSETLRSSYNTGDYPSVHLMPSARIILDTEYPKHYALSDVEVYLEVDQTQPVKFTRCTFSGEGKFLYNNNKRFYNCEIRESLFSDDYDYEFTEFNDCSSSLYLWNDADKYAVFCKKNKSKSIDFGMKELKENFDVDWDCTISNAIIDKLHIGIEDSDEFVVRVKMDNVRFRLRKHCYIEELVCQNVTTEGSTYNIYCNNFLASNSVFTSEVVAVVISSYNSRFDYITVAYGNISSTIFEISLKVVDVDGVVQNLTISNCNFSGSSNIKFMGRDSSTSKITVKNSIIISNAFIGTKRALYEPVGDIKLTIDDSCIIKWNANAMMDFESSDAEWSRFNRVHVANEAYVHCLQTDFAPIHFGTNEKSMENLTKDGSIFFKYDEVFDNNKEVYVPRGPAKMYIKVKGEWIEVG